MACGQSLNVTKKPSSTSLRSVQYHVSVCFTVPSGYSGNVQIFRTKILMIWMLRVDFNTDDNKTFFLNGATDCKTL